MVMFTIVTATYNLISGGRENLIREALQSVWDQDFKDYECVIQDGGSQDGTLELLNRIAETAPPRIKVRIFSEPDTGLYQAMNRAVAKANGQYIILLNSDDSFASFGALSSLAKKSGNGRLDFIFGTYIHLGVDGQERLFRRSSLKPILQRMPYCHQSLAVKKSVFDKISGFDLRYKMAADYDFNLRLVAGGFEGSKLNVPIARFREGGVSSDTQAIAKEHALIWKRNFSQWMDVDALSLKECESWYWRGSLPVNVAWKILSSPNANPSIRRAALHSLLKSIRRKLRDMLSPARRTASL